MKIVVVESPAKAKTINKYLGPDYEVLASFGHVRDLPAKDGSVDPEHDFKMLWEVDDKSQKRLNDIARAVKGADGLILATDPDREGEAISWHVLEVLKEKNALKKQSVERVVFNAITKNAVAEAMANPRQIDGALVDAYLARRALDYLVGFTLSPVLWRKLPGARSAGRVQSVALRLVCDRELEIEKFVAQEYWSLVAHLKTRAGEPFTARLVGADGKKITRLDIGKGDEAEDFKKALDAATAEDLVSQVFLDVWRTARQFEGRAQVSTWLLSIARFKALTALRQRQHEDIDQDDVLEIADGSDSPETALDRSRTSDILRACIAKLSPAHREIINLVYYHEMSVEEVGRIVGIPQSTVKTRMFYARKQLAELLKSYGVESLAA